MTEQRDGAAAAAGGAGTAAASGEAAAIDAKTFWRTLGMRPVGVAAITSQGPDGPAGFLALSVTHVTADPPSLQKARLVSPG